MRRAAAAIGTLGLVTGVVGGLLGFGTMLSLGLGPPFSSLLDVIVPVVALFAVARVRREPALAGTLLAGCGVAASFRLGCLQTLLYLVAGMLALLGEREIPRDAPLAARPLPTWLPRVGRSAAISAAAAVLCSGVNAMAQAPPTGDAPGAGFAVIYITFAGLAAAVLSTLGLAGARMCARRPWRGCLLMTFAGFLTTPPSLVVAGAVPAFGLWVLTSNAALIVAGVGVGLTSWQTGTAATKAPAAVTRAGGPGPERRPVPRVGVALVALAVVATLYAGRHALEVDGVLGLAFPQVLGPRLEVSAVAPMAAEGCIAIGPELPVYGYGWLGSGRVRLDIGYGLPRASLVIADSAGKACRFTLAHRLAEGLFPLGDCSGLVFASMVFPMGDRSQLFLRVPTSPTTRLLSGRFRFQLSPSGRFLLCAGDARSVVYDLSSTTSVRAGPVLDTTGQPFWSGEMLAVRGVSGDAEGAYRVFPLEAGKTRAGITLPGEPSCSGDGRWLAVLVPCEADPHQGSGILVYDLDSLVASEPAEPRARLSPRGEGLSSLVWSDDGAKLAYLDGPCLDEHIPANAPPTALMVADGPSFAPRLFPMTARDTWKPISFSTDGRYLLATDSHGSGSANGLVLDTETGTGSTLPSGISQFDFDNAFWLGPSTLWVCPTTGSSSPPWFYYDATTAQVLPCPWQVSTGLGQLKLSPDRRQACVSVYVFPTGRAAFGPFTQLSPGEWLFVFPVGPR